MNPKNIIDLSVIETLRGLVQPGEPDFADTMIDLFLASTPQSVRELQQAIKKRDYVRVAQTAHSLKSSAATLGALTLAGVCFELEKLQKLANRDDLLDLMSIQFRAEFQRATEALSALKTAA